MTPRERALFWGGLIAVLVLGALLRLHDLGGPAFDCDELYAFRIHGASLRSAAEVLGRSAFHDLHPPLSYLLFLPWVDRFGMSEAGVRSLPMALGLLSIVLVGLVGRRIGGAWVGLAAAAFVAFNPLHIAYSQEARPYALAVALTLAAHLFFLRSLGERAAWNRIVYALLVVAAVYTHYFALIALFPHGLVALWLLLTGDEASRRAARPTLLAFGCGMATFIAWLPALFFQTTSQATGPTLGVYELGQSPLARAGTFLNRVEGLGAAPFLLPATLALFVLLAMAWSDRRRLPAAPVDAAAADRLPPRWPGVLALLAGALLGGGLYALAPRLFGPARQLLRQKGYAPDAVERELHAFLGFTVSIPLALGAIGLLALAWPWLSSLPERFSRAGREGRPLAINVLLMFLGLTPLLLTVALALKGVPFLTDRNLLVCEAPLALALGLGAVRLARMPRARLALAPVLLCLLLGRLQYQSLSGIFGRPGQLLGMQTGDWRALTRELDRHGDRSLPLVLANTPGSDPAEFYLHDLDGHSVTRVTDAGPAAPASLPGEFRFVHLKGNPSSDALLARLSGAASLAPEFQVDEFVVYDARPQVRVAGQMRLGG